jgi:hypothetical protein
MTRVSNDLRTIQSRVNTTAADIEAVQSASVLQQGLTTLELGSRLLLGMIFFEASLSALTGLALMMIGHPRLHMSAPLAAVRARDDDQF